MEVGLLADIPTYSGGLGILAGDTIRAAADLSIPMVGVTLLHRKGYFYQALDGRGWQNESAAEWVVEDQLVKMDNHVTVTIEGRQVNVAAWRFDVRGIKNFVVPVYFLDTNLSENSPEDRNFTDTLYGGDQRYRLAQEIILGYGGVRMLRALGYQGIERFHMNEGHASFLTLALLNEELRKEERQTVLPKDLDAVRHQCVFTTHTPVTSGHDRFPIELVNRVLGRHAVADTLELCCFDDNFNMTYLALNLSHYINGVAKRHAEVAKYLFAKYTIDSITNGVHAGTWVSPAMARLFDQHLPTWREENYSLRYALSIPAEEVWQAHQAAKRDLLQFVNRLTNAGMETDVFTIGFARRMTAYKRPDLFFSDLDRLRLIASNAGPFQIIFAGKAHPHDTSGKELIQHIYWAKEALKDVIRVVFVPNYDIEFGKLITAGSDVWLNNPQPPLEASGTSGMKAALNGVPSLSTLDGWWIEGCIEGLTGWSFGESEQSDGSEAGRKRDASALYDKLQYVVMPMFYQNLPRYLDIMRHAIALNGSFFNTHRMIQQYVLKAYL
ncbi:MAG: alpha-glucan family phosphorylase [Candidatus Tectomicrobia bacterium]|nr:alpha-glucan family phosphorylase [Candidatus Tectomicrobia bacterium]